MINIKTSPLNQNNHPHISKEVTFSTTKHITCRVLEPCSQGYTQNHYTVTYLTGIMLCAGMIRLTGKQFILGDERIS